MRILFVEPDIILAKSYKYALEALGHAVDMARSAQSAVYMADRVPPDVVVLELQLPRHNGVEFLYEFRSYQEWLSIPIIINTYVPLGELQHGTNLPAELGVVAMLYKPVTTLMDLRLAVQQCVPTATA